MNRLFAFIFLVAFAVAACQSDAPTDQTDTDTEETTAEGETPATNENASANDAESMDAELFEEIEGFYVGRFEADKYNGEYLYSMYNKINISVDSVIGDTLYGHSTVAGNFRPFKGPWTEDGVEITVTAREPGDDPYDGLFEFTIDSEVKRMEGTWKSYNKNLKVYQRKYNLMMMYYKYDADAELTEDVAWEHMYDEELGEEQWVDEGEFLTEDVYAFNASNTALTKEDVENLYKGDLEVIRNSIYARHGYSFKNRKIRYIFDKYVEWYIPVNVDVRDKLTDLEKKNIDLLKRYEQHAEEYYDVFGR